jgi:hypothetical protein
MRIQNVQNQNFGAIRITPGKFTKFDSKDLAEFTNIAKSKKVELETGRISRDSFSLNVMTKENSLEEYEAFISLIEYVGMSGKKIAVEPVLDKSALASIAKIEKEGIKK